MIRLVSLAGRCLNILHALSELFSRMPTLSAFCRMLKPRTSSCSPVKKHEPHWLLWCQKLHPLVIFVLTFLDLCAIHPSMDQICDGFLCFHFLLLFFFLHQSFKKQTTFLSLLMSLSSQCVGMDFVSCVFVFCFFLCQRFLKGKVSNVVIYVSFFFFFTKTVQRVDITLVGLYFVKWQSARKRCWCFQMLKKNRWKKYRNVTERRRVIFCNSLVYCECIQPWWWEATVTKLC